jgi:cytosine/adenosine deaminase-related metal-dependent hydrolase
MRGRVLRVATPAGERSFGIDDEGRWVNPDPTDSPAVIDLTAWAALPGLVDAHAHLAAGSIEELLDQTRRRDRHVARHSAEQLAGGVLLVGDKGTDDDETVGFTLALDPAERPEVELAGALLATAGGYYPGIATEIEGSALGDQVDRYGPEGVRWVKLIGDWPRRGRGALSNWTEAELAAAVEQAHLRGMRVAIHTCAPDVPGMAVRAGIDSIEHGLFLDEDDIAMLGERGGA